MPSRCLHRRQGQPVLRHARCEIYYASIEFSFRLSGDGVQGVTGLVVSTIVIHWGEVPYGCGYRLIFHGSVKIFSLFGLVWLASQRFGGGNNTTAPGARIHCFMTFLCRQLSARGEGLCLSTSAGMSLPPAHLSATRNLDRPNGVRGSAGRHFGPDLSAPHRGAFSDGQRPVFCCTRDA